jgi:hypothetical protein
MHQRFQKLCNDDGRVGEINPVAFNCVFLPADVLDKKFVLAIVWSDDTDKVFFTDPELIVIKDHRYASSLSFRGTPRAKYLPSSIPCSTSQTPS